MDDNRFQEIKEDIKRGRKYDVPNDYECNYESLYDTMDELVAAVEASQVIGKIWQEQETDLRKQLDASHAVNDVYKNMVGVLELTIELLETNGER